MFDDFFHRYPKDRGFFERLVRKIMLAPGKKRFWNMNPSSKFETSAYRDARRKRKFPFRYAVSKALEEIGDFYEYKIAKKAKDAKWWVLHRTIHRYNVINIRSLKPGYYDYDTRMLHACFQLLEDYVEEGLASQNSEGFEEQFKRGRCVAAGLGHLDWAISDPDCNQGASPNQADRAREHKELYLWWTVERPARIEPWGDASIWEEWRKKNPDNDEELFMGHKVGKPHEIAGNLDEFYRKQDGEMLARLIAAKDSLWT